MQKAKPGPAEKRAALREEHWPNSDRLIWTSKEGKGYCSMPRTISLIATLIRQLSPTLDPSRVYIDLWCRNFDEGVIEVGNEIDFAAACGYSGTRSARTWRDRVAALESLGFLAVKPIGKRKYGFILLLHPHDVVATLRAAPDSRVPDWWWSLFTNRLREIGAVLRSQ